MLKVVSSVITFVCDFSFHYFHYELFSVFSYIHISDFYVSLKNQSGI